jgi:hypothetical protein
MAYLCSFPFKLLLPPLPFPVSPPVLPSVCVADAEALAEVAVPEERLV